MDRRAFLLRATTIATVAALPFQRVAQVAQQVAPKTAILGEISGRALVPNGTRLIAFERGAQAGWIGWVENELGHTVGWLSETGVYRTVGELTNDGYLAPRY